MNKFLLVALVALTPTFAFAGGSSKSTGAVKVTNTDAANVAYVAVNPSNALKTAIDDGSVTKDSFIKLGGKIVAPKTPATFSSVKVGSAIVYFAIVPTAATAADIKAAIQEKTVTVAKGKTTSVDLP